MRKITAGFGSIAKIQKLKKIMRKVYSEKNDNIAEIAKFNLNKNLIPEQVEKAELEFTKIIGSNLTITIPKDSITFLRGQHPFTKIANNHGMEGKYIVLPWNIGTSTGLENLKNLIDQIPATAKSLKYTIYINTEAGSGSDVGSFAELSVSRSYTADNTEQLFNEIETLNSKLQDSGRKLSDAIATIERQKTSITEEQRTNTALNSKISTLTIQNNNLQSQVAGLNSQVISLNGQISNLNSRIVVLSKNQVTWDTRIPNQTTLDLVGFTGKVVANINPTNGTFRVNVI